MKALLVRVGVDQAYGCWNAPVAADNSFVYVPIPEGPRTVFHAGHQRSYGELRSSLAAFCNGQKRALHLDLKFPELLHDQQAMHLDPDFEHLTYGDIGSRRGSGMVGMTNGDLLVFYAGLRPVHPCEHKLIYAIIGLYVVDEVLSVSAIPKDRWQENAHTRKSTRGETDIVVRAKPVVSGRLSRCIPIGEWRNGAYRVRQDLLDEWGGLSVKDGFIQRSAVPPRFTEPSRFLHWFERQDPILLTRNF